MVRDISTIIHIQIIEPYHRFLVHANIPFSVVENPFFHDFVNALQPMYPVPSRSVISSRIFQAELARVDIIEHDKLQERKFCTWLVDSWEDSLGRSIYGNVLTEVKAYPVVTGLSDLTGKRATAENIVTVCLENMKKAGIEPQQVYALCTDNPTVMISVWKKIEDNFPWILVRPTFCPWYQRLEANNDCADIPMLSSYVEYSYRQDFRLSGNETNYQSKCTSCLFF